MGNPETDLDVYTTLAFIISIISLIITIISFHTTRRHISLTRDIHETIVRK